MHTEDVFQLTKTSEIHYKVATLHTWLLKFNYNWLVGILVVRWWSYPYAVHY